MTFYLTAGSSQCVIDNCFKSSLNLHNNNKDIFYFKDNAFKNNKNNNNDDVFLNMLIKSNEKARIVSILFIEY